MASAAPSRFRFSDFRFEAAAATLSGTGSASPTRSQQLAEGAAFTLFLTLSAREGADGQAVVCPLLRGSSPTRWVEPKQHRGPGSRESPSDVEGLAYGDYFPGFRDQLHDIIRLFKGKPAKR
jgi:hypothetical protein